MVGKRMVISENGFYVLNTIVSGDVPPAEYEIAHDRIPTYETLLAWILHLSEKAWVTREHIKDLIYCWETVTGNDINRTLP